MASPVEVTIHNLTGEWTLNRVMSDDPCAAMAIQGVSWFVRTMLSRAPISLSIVQAKDLASGEETYAAVQRSLGRVVEDRRTLNWDETKQSHAVFGELKTRARFSAIEVIASQFLREGWEDGTCEVIEVQVEGSGWTSWQAWGFGVIDGIRHHIRRAVVRKGGQFCGDVGRESIKAEMYYDMGPDCVAVKMVYDWNRPTGNDHAGGKVAG